MLISATTPDLLLSLVASATLLERAAAAFPGPAARSRPFDPAAVRRNCLLVSLCDSLRGCGCPQGQGRRRRGRAASRWATFLIVEDDGKEDLSEAEKVLISTI